MIRYKTELDLHGLVPLYDIRPGNGAGLFLQPRSPHGDHGLSGRAFGNLVSCTKPPKMEV